MDLIRNDLNIFTFIDCDRVILLTMTGFGKRLFLLTIAIVFLYLPAKPANKWALIIAIGNYPKESGWNTIHSFNDVGIIKKGLMVSGFKENDIALLIDKEATKAGIINAFNLLSSKIKQGDIIYIHFSCHGQQIRDDNNDEPDGYDEALIPYDACKTFNSSGYQGQNHLRDDLLGEMIVPILNKIGEKGDLLLVLDACHSGTATRDIAGYRGTEEVFSDIPDSTNLSVDENEYFEIPVTRGMETNRGHYTIISGSGPRELNYEYRDPEGKYFGSLSFALAKELINMNNKSTYRDLFEKVKLEMYSLAPRQNPVVEGDIDRKVWTGEIVKSFLSFNVISVVNETTITINAGMLYGVYENTKIELFMHDPLPPAISYLLTTGYVTKSGVLESTVKLSGRVDKNKVLNAVAIVKQYSLGFGKVTVNISPVIQRTYSKQIKMAESEGWFTISETGQDYSLELKNGFFLVISNNNGKVGSFPEKEAERINENLIQIIKVDRLRSLEVKDSNLDFQLEMIPITVKKEAGKFIEDQRLALTSKTIKGSLTFTEGDCFKIRISNNSSQLAYYQVLDIQPDNKVNLLIPYKSYTPYDFSLKPGEKVELPEIFTISRPFGTDFFKLIVTQKPINLEFLTFNVKPEKRAGESNSSDQFLDDFLFNNERGINNPVKKVYISTKLVKINPK